MRWAVLLIFGTIGLAALAGGTIWGLDVYPVFRDTIQVRGTVVEEVAEKSAPSSDVAYFPVVEFTAAGDGTVRFRASTGSEGAPGHEVGDAVDVLYDPRNPTNARIGSFGQLWSGPLTTGGLGLILFLLTLLLFIKIGRFEKGIKAVGSGKKEEGL
jgi:uncharacterized protein DUF3592